MYVQYIWLIKSGKKEKSMKFERNYTSDDCVFNSNIK